MATGYVAGPTIAGLVLGPQHHWHAVSLYSGGVQIVGVVIFLYGELPPGRDL